MRTLQRLVEQRRTLVADKVRLTNRLTDALKQYFPQVLEWFKDKDTVVFCDFLTRWPTLKQAQQARKARLTPSSLSTTCAIRHIVEERLQAILQATPLTSDAGVIGPNRLLVEASSSSDGSCSRPSSRFDLEIAPLAPTLPDYALFRTLPGAGAVYAPRLLAAFGEPRERYQSAAEVQRYAGLAPVTERSGNQVLGALASPLPQVPAPDVRGVGRPVHPALLLGQGILRAAAREGLLTPGRSARVGLQVDSNRVPLLARPYPVRRSHLPHRPKAPRLTPPPMHATRLK